MQSIISLLLTAKLLQSCSTLCDPRDGSLPGSLIPGILQARTLEWVAISFSSAWMWKVKGKSLSHVRLLATPGTAAYQAPLSMGFPRQEYWSGLPLFSPTKSKSLFFTSVSLLLSRIQGYCYHLSKLHPYALIGEGNGNPLQNSCLENLMDRGAW